MNIQYPDYNNCIANLACSIMKYFGVEPPNKTLAKADVLLQKQYKNVVLILLDGMGVNILEKHLEKEGFFRSNVHCYYSSTFPPTTVAAMTAVDSGLFPNQSAWLAWTGYFKELDRNIVYFLNVDYDTGEDISEIFKLNAARSFVPYTSICEKIKSTGLQAYSIAPFIEPFPRCYDDFCTEIKKLCSTDEHKYVYAYWHEPDLSMHDNGIDGKKIGNLLKDLEVKTQQLASELSDTLLIITADHGHINVKNQYIFDYPDICECLLRMPSMEARALNIFVKSGMEERFEEVFKKHFDGQFLLFTKSEVLEKNLLGCGENHERLDEMLGDYLAVAVSDVGIRNTDNKKFKGHHAGFTKEEMTIPLIAVSK